MEYTEQQKSEIRRQFQARRRRQIILTIPVVLCLVLLFAMSGKERETIGGMEPSVLLAPLFVVIVAAVGYSFYNWRCPACSKYLGKTISPSFCVRCGVSLR
jgi:hypothetical protein